MPATILTCEWGHVALPDPTVVMVSRLDGGQLIVNPPRDVWDRTALTPQELSQWSFLIAATARAMLDGLPQLRDGCINYWDAGNWALNDAAAPAGRKAGPHHRKLHMHVLGRSPGSADPAWAWGEAPLYPLYADRYTWAEGRQRLSPDECAEVVTRIISLLHSRYGMSVSLDAPGICEGCGYPAPASRQRCAECAHTHG